MPGTPPGSGWARVGRGRVAGACAGAGPGVDGDPSSITRASTSSSRAPPAGAACLRLWTRRRDVPLDVPLAGERRGPRVVATLRLGAAVAARDAEPAKGGEHREHNGPRLVGCAGLDLADARGASCRRTSPAICVHGRDRLTRAPMAGADCGNRALARTLQQRMLALHEPGPRVRGVQTASASTLPSWGESPSGRSGRACRKCQSWCQMAQIATCTWFGRS